MFMKRWRTVTSKKPKFATEVFIREHGTDGKFIAKAYGFDGQTALENAQVMADAPLMLKLVGDLVRDIELASKLINGRPAKSNHVRSAHALVRKYGANHAKT